MSLILFPGKLCNQSQNSLPVCRVKQEFPHNGSRHVYYVFVQQTISAQHFPNKNDVPPVNARKMKSWVCSAFTKIKITRWRSRHHRYALNVTTTDNSEWNWFSSRFPEDIIKDFSLNRTLKSVRWRARFKINARRRKGNKNIKGMTDSEPCIHRISVGCTTY